MELGSGFGLLGLASQLEYELGQHGAIRMQFMVTFSLTHRQYKERVARFLQTGAQPPEGVVMHGRWFTASHNQGYMLVEADDSKPLFRWTSQWADLIDFSIEPVVTDEEAGPILAELK